MGQTIVEKIFSEHANKEVYAGEIVRVKVDMTIGNDITTPISIRAFKESGAKKLANPEGFCIVLDHFVPAKDIASANQCKISRDFAYEQDMPHTCLGSGSVDCPISKVKVKYVFSGYSLEE